MIWLVRVCKGPHRAARLTIAIGFAALIIGCAVNAIWPKWSGIVFAIGQSAWLWAGTFKAVAAMMDEEN